MAHFTCESYNPPFPFTNGHINTIFPSLFRNGNHVKYKRMRMATSDDDFIDLDYSRVGSEIGIILCHGLEGSSESSYILGMVRYFNNNGFDTISINHRSCSGEMNNQLKMYNSGSSDDLHEIIQFVKKEYSKIYLVGFSLGGNIVLKYLGEEIFSIPDKVQAAVAFSTPCDLLSSSYMLESKQTMMYRNKFLISLRQKMQEKHKRFPEEIDLIPLKTIKNLREFDDLYTAPIHGYKDALDYYTKCSSKQFLSKIRIPTLLVNAIDDPFLSPDCMPFTESASSSFFHFIATKHGGHVGFVSFSKVYWSERIALAFLKAQD